ncbi:hypothetical protein MWH28_11485 [Natroniella sulfidigena]|uniref:hypothetical protein n=1 Tax=Natroniella sulfidigena TaxID=723921 RepID=UPI00200A243E|nr:hypothetical protein [Natroniella sulfidigena]MCK8817978.1 hypothetical protein [Natroniella sulfidigena]
MCTEIERSKMEYKGRKYMNLKEVAILVGKPLIVLENRVKNGELAAKKVKGEWYVPQKEYKKLTSYAMLNQGRHYKST